MKCPKDVIFIYHDKRRKSRCKQACPRRFVMKSRKGKRGQRERERGNKTSGIAGVVQNVRKGRRKGEERQRQREKTREKVRNELKGTECKQEVEMNSTRIFLRIREALRECCRYIRFPDSGEGLRSN